MAIIQNGCVLHLKALVGDFVQTVFRNDHVKLEGSYHYVQDYN